MSKRNAILASEIQTESLPVATFRIVEDGETQMMAREKILELRGITKRFAGVSALSQVDLDLQEGEVLALLGENGAGKSTLMKILSGVHQPDGGTIRFRGEEMQFSSPRDAQKLGISIIYQEFSLVPHLPVFENIFYGQEKRTRWGSLDRKAMRQEAKIILQKLGVLLDVTRTVAQLSIAEQQFVEIAKALTRDTRILILDEPTATLTSQEADQLFRVMRQLRESGVAMIFISHHLEEIFTIGDRVQCLRDGRSVGTLPISECTTASLVKMIAGRDIAHAFPLRMGPEPGPVVLDVRKLRLQADSPTINFSLREGEILGFAGLIGSGRTEIMRALIGADRSAERVVLYLGKKFTPASPADACGKGFGLVPEDRKQQGLILPFSVADNIVLTNLGAISHPMLHKIQKQKGIAVVDTLIKKLRIKTPSAEQIVRNLSGGNQQKVVIAKWLHADCQVLIFDEPTRGIDVGAKSEIYELMRVLAAKGVSIIMISSELPEVVGMSDRVVVMRQNRVEKLIERAEEITAENIMHYATGAHNL